MKKLLFTLSTVLIILTSCKDTIFYQLKICDSTIYNQIDSVIIKDSVSLMDSTIYYTVIKDSIVYHKIDSILYRDSVIMYETIIFVDSVVYRDSVVISDTVRLIETGNGNIYISGAEHTTFNIDLDSIKVLIRNDSIIDVWQRPPAQIE